MMVPLRNYHKMHTNRVKGIVRMHRRKMFDEKIYYKRSINESINSSIKRRFGSFVNSVLEKNIVKQIYLKGILYNLSILKKLSKSIAYILRIYLMRILQSLFIMFLVILQFVLPIELPSFQMWICLTVQVLMCILDASYY